MKTIRAGRRYLLLAFALVFAATTGVLASTALGLGAADPAKTVTVNVGTGPQGPPGPPGPKGDPGGAVCPQGFSQGKLVINHATGHVSIWTCIAD